MEYKLGKDLFPEDNVIEPITFDQLILALHCNYAHPTVENLYYEFNTLHEIYMEDAMFLLEKNADKILELAKSRK